MHEVLSNDELVPKTPPKRSYTHMILTPFKGYFKITPSYVQPKKIKIDQDKIPLAISGSVYNEQMKKKNKI